MDFEKENEQLNEQTNESSENVGQDTYSQQETNNSDDSQTTASRQDGYSFEQNNGYKAGEYRIPNPKQDHEFNSEYNRSESGYYNSYNAGNSQPGGSSNGNEQRNTYNNSYNDNRYNNNPYNNYHENNNDGYAPKTKSSKKGKVIIAVLLVVCIIFASIGAVSAIVKYKKHSNTDVSVSETSDKATLEIDSTNTSVTNAATVSPGTIVAKKARASVVGVVAYNASGSLYGEGSGVVMGQNEAGNLTYIITCAHVISDSSIASYGILLEDGTVYDAKMVGYDERTDLGVLSIKETNLQAATFGDSSALQVGETIYAIGNPGGSSFYGSITDGIVSALDRSITSTYTMQVIQHTAAISPGNSGGALVNSVGQVVGINSSKIAATDYEAIGFAIPMKTVKSIVEDIISYGYVPNRPKLGISYASVSDYQAYSMVVNIKGLPAGSVIIAEISDESSLKDTDVQVGDMITSVNGKDLTSSDVLLDAIDSAKVGDKIELEICRIDPKTYKVNTFKVTAKVIEDKPSKEKEETTTQSYYEYYSNGNDFDMNDFFEKFFGSGF